MLFLWKHWSSSLQYCHNIDIIFGAFEKTENIEIICVILFSGRITQPLCQSLNFGLHGVWCVLARL